MNDIVLNQDRSVELLHRVKSKIKHPVNFWAVYATLESMGLRDVDAQQEFGHQSLSKLADFIHAEISKSDPSAQDISSNYFSGQSFLEQSLRFIKYYVLGLFIAFALVINVATILLYDYGLWAWINFNTLQATVVANGTILSFIVTGGFLQVIGQQLSYYKENDLIQGYRIVTTILMVGSVSIFLIALLCFAVNSVIPFYTIEMMSISLTYMTLLSFLLLTSGVLNALEQRVPIGASFVIGILCVFLGMEILDIGIYLSHWLGLLMATLINTVYSYFYFKLRLSRLEYNMFLAKKVDVEIILFWSYRYFVYGFFLSIFLFLDRILAWSAGSPLPLKIIWFNTIFELGMDWALLPFLLTLATLEFIIQTFSLYLIPAQEYTSLNYLDKFKNYFFKFYRNKLILLILISIVSIISCYYFLLLLKPYASSIPKLEVFFINPVIVKIYWMASIGYLFLAIGLYNSMFFFSLNRPAFSVNAIVWAVLINGVFGLIFSRMISFEYSVLGLMAGSIVFAVLTTIKAREFFTNIDYYYYSAL